MEKHDALRRAVRQSPAPELPAGFTERLMERVRLDARRRERRVMRRLAAAGVGCFALLAAACGWMISAWTDLELPAFEMPHLVLPRFELPPFDLRMHAPSLSAADKSLALLFSGVALVFLILALADLLLRRRLGRAASRK